MDLTTTKINWYGEICKNESKLTEAIEYFNKKYEDYSPVIKLDGNKLSRESAELPYIVSVCHSDWSILEAISEYFDIKLKAAKAKHYKKYLETYARQLSSNDVKNYIEGEQEVVALQAILNEIRLVRNKYVGLTKALESKNWQISNLTKIKSSGLDLVEF